jgi:hypothetical protein
MEDQEFTDKDIEDIASTITDEDLRARSQSLHEAQETWEELQFIATPKIPCRECGGAGSVQGGSFGSICVGCMGERMVAAPGSPKFDMPDFSGMRKAIGAYGDAIADRALPDGHKGKRHLALPAPASVPTIDAIQALAEQGLAKCRQLQAGGGPGVFDPKQLPEARPARGLAGEGDLSEYEDAELAELEDAASQCPSPRCALPRDHTGVHRTQAGNEHPPPRRRR